MKTLRRHAWIMAVVSLSVILAGTLWWRSTRQSTALADPPGDPYEPLSVIERDAIEGLLEDISLDRDALIALNVDADQAESLLDAVRDWRADNAATLNSLKGAIDERTLALRQIERAIAMGPYEAGREAALALAGQELAAADAAYRSALAPLETGVNALLSESQRAAWAATQSGHGQTMPLRMLSLTDQQRLALSRAQRHYRWQLAAASTQEQRNAVVTARETSLGQILTVDQQAVINAYHNYYADASEAVADAHTTVLPVDEA